MGKLKKVKSPNDYPLFGYRVLPDIKESLTSQLEEVLKSKNKARPSEEKPLKKNDVFVKALQIGLKSLRKQEGDYNL